MDDWIVIAPSKWKLRKAVRKVNQVLEKLELEKHPDKTFIGKAERGFDFLGYHFGPEGLTVAKETLYRFVERGTRLYEQEPGKPCGSSRFGLQGVAISAISCWFSRLVKVIVILLLLETY